ncbi:hypothetical protein [Flavobacterium cellulosilyticum]|uniref:Uncharacterized protein n=1 Tax=Flavobacterium cellulosilyticum TaxID=2541731 RepID=A0A4R5CAM1_9FLAO|nr:hypothetical protein [Flavobacterium cellulosilyticum]TDD96968.1 hypothetical protein E0F76_10020 [Flavobacterium cellulosilyticum]
MNTFETKTGFSIELIENRLILRGEYNNLPLYESIGGIITAIALVSNPAVEINSIADEDNKILCGVVMSPNLNIFRDIGRKGKENCYWYFSAHTIEKLQNSFKGEIKIGH